MCEINHICQHIPSPVVEIIINWTLEFHRADAIQRTDTFRSVFDDSMKRICEDVRMNTPIYKFSIRTQPGTLLYLNLFLPDCDPYRVRPHQVPESHIYGFTRRSIGLVPHLQPTRPPPPT